MSCSIKRRGVKNLLTVGIGMVLIVLLNLYFGNIRSYEKQLESLAENVPVYCQITNKNGSRVNGLFIAEDVVDGICSSDLTRDESYMVWMMAGEGDFKPSECAGNLNLFAAGVNRAEAAPGMTADKIHMEKGNAEDFFLSDAPECIVSENVMEKRGWHVGDHIMLNLYYYDGDNFELKLYTYPLELAEVEIVGTMEEGMMTTSALPADVILPFETVREIFHKNAIPFMTDTLSFYVKDPLQLNELKAQMSDLRLGEKDIAARDSYTGYTLIVRDDSFISRADELQYSKKLMETFLPIVCLLVLVIGYVVSYLAGNSRMEEYVLLRFQGVKKMKGAALFLMEQMILLLMGNCLGDAAVLLFSSDLSTILAVNGILLIAYLTGATAAYWRMSKGNLMQLLSAKQ